VGVVVLVDTDEQGSLMTAVILLVPLAGYEHTVFG